MNDSGARQRAIARRARSRGVSAVEIALGVAIVGSLLAVAVPAFVRNFHASHLVEATSGVTAIAESATAYASTRTVDQAYPASVARTPEEVPAGESIVDADAIWDAPTWKALDFRPVAPGLRHRYAFSFSSTLGKKESRFTAKAEGDLDGDGRLGTFIARGSKIAGSPPRIEPGVEVDDELE